MDMSSKITLDLMNESVFPRDSIYLSKENPKKNITKGVPRIEMSDEDIIAAVSEDMANSLGAELEP